MCDRYTIWAFVFIIIFHSFLSGKPLLSVSCCCMELSKLFVFFFFSICHLLYMQNLTVNCNLGHFTVSLSSSLSPKTIFQKTFLSLISWGKTLLLLWFNPFKAIYGREVNAFFHFYKSCKRKYESLAVTVKPLGTYLSSWIIKLDIFFYPTLKKKNSLSWELSSHRVAEWTYSFPVLLCSNETCAVWSFILVCVWLSLESLQLVWKIPVYMWILDR